MTDPDGGIPLETIRRVMERVDRQTVDVTPVPLLLDHKRQQDLELIMRVDTTQRKLRTQRMHS